MSKSKDEEVREVVSELDQLLAQLDANVRALTAILVPAVAHPNQEAKTP